MMNFAEFKEKIIADGECFGGVANPKAEGVLKFMYNGFLTQGVAYCPCQGAQTPETVCPCVKYQKGEGCCCGLFLTK